MLAASAYATIIVSGTTYNATGTFDGGDTLSGTITIGSGGIQSEDLTVNADGTLYTFTGGPSGSGIVEIGSSGTYYDNAQFAGNLGSSLILDIYLGAHSSFSGYTGGPLCSDNQSCGTDVETSFSAEGDPNLGSGNLDPVPEPSAALLAFAGGGVLEMLRRMKRYASLRRTLLSF